MDAIWARNDNESIHALMARVLDRTRQDSLRDRAIRSLQYIGSIDVLRRCQRMAAFRDPWLRQCAAEIVAKLGLKEADFPVERVEHPFPDEAKALLNALLAAEEDVDVLCATIQACDDLYDGEEALPLAGLERHPDAAVRFAVARALYCHRSGDSIDLLLPLSRDEDDDVRDWATFALAAHNDDREIVRTALFERIDDPDLDTRCEAMLGLARRCDLRLIGPLCQSLRDDEVTRLQVEAAGMLGHPALAPALEDLVGWWDVDDKLLADAIDECRGRPVDPDAYRAYRWDRLPRYADEDPDRWADPVTPAAAPADPVPAAR